MHLKRDDCLCLTCYKRRKDQMLLLRRTFLTLKSAITSSIQLVLE